MSERASIGRIIKIPPDGEQAAYAAYPEYEQRAERTSFALAYVGVKGKVGDKLLADAEQRMERLRLGDAFRAGLAAARS